MNRGQLNRNRIAGIALLIPFFALGFFGPISQKKSNLSRETPALLGSDWVDHHDSEPGESEYNQPLGLVGGTDSARHSHARSPKWPTVRAHWIADGHDSCEACGSRVDLNVHHVIPYAENRLLELDPTNLITLCRDCHFRFGHDPDGPGGTLRPDWKKANPNVRSDAENHRKKLNPERR